MEAPEPRKFKIIIIGDSQVGKTSLIKRYAYDNFYESVIY